MLPWNMLDLLSQGVLQEGSNWVERRDGGREKVPGFYIGDWWAWFPDEGKHAVNFLIAIDYRLRTGENNYFSSLEQRIERKERGLIS